MLKRDFEWFVANYTNLFEQYGSCYIAIKNKQVLGSYPSYAEGVTVTSANEPLGTFIVQKCDGTEAGYTNYIASMNFIV